MSGGVYASIRHDLQLLAVVCMVVVMTYSHEIAHDLRNAGWRDAGFRTRGPLAVLEFTRGDRRKWVLVDIATDAVVGGQY